MLISFVGSPASGKTTTAAKLFASLKDRGMVVEFVAEQARWYIAQERILKQKSVFTDKDQMNILKKQLHCEKIMKKSCGKNGIVITDTSALNALLYMSEEARNLKNVKNIVKTITSTKHYDLTFLCQPIEINKIEDPNRIHSLSESKKIHKSIEAVFYRFAPEIKLLHLTGTSEERYKQALKIIEETI